MTPRAARVETPADTLRRAAAKVRELAAEATQGEWFDDAHFQGDGFVVMADGLRRAHLPKVRRDDIDDGNGSPAGNAAWIAALNPAVAEPLAAWLDDAAEYEDGADKLDAIGDGCSRWDGASRDLPLALARVLLGSPVPEPDGEGT